MALDNNGVARRIYEDSDAPLQLQGFYDEVANPLLLDIELQYPENAISELTQANFKQYYDGSEIVVAGKITDDNLESLIAEVIAQTANEKLTLKAEVKVSEVENVTQQQQYIFGDFTERLWAYLTIQQLLEKRVSADTNEKQNLTDRILELSLKYSFVTPLTSMVVTKPEGKTNDTFVADKPSEDGIPKRHYAPPLPGIATRHYAHPVHGYRTRQRAPLRPAIHDISLSSYDLKTSSRLISTAVDSDPHFIISMNNHNDAICFNIDGKPGAILNLVTDPYTGFVVNGQLIGEKKIENNKKINTYFGKFGIVNNKMDVKVEVSTQAITVFHGEDKIIFPWSATVSLTKESFSISIMKEKNLTVTMGDNATFVIVLHRVWKNHPLHRDFLGFYTLDNHRLSNMTHGLLGQFYHEVNAEIYNIRPGLDQGKPDATMIVKGHKLRVTRGSQKDYRFDPKRGTNIPCWFVHYSGKGFIDGTPTDYIVSSLFGSLYP